VRIGRTGRSETSELNVLLDHVLRMAAQCVDELLGFHFANADSMHLHGQMGLLSTTTLLKD
jgi:hypothetical protein